MGSHLSFLRPTPCPPDSEPFPATLTTPALNRRSLRWFGLPACTANPEGQTSITGTARFVPTTFYIAFTLLSGRTTDRRFRRLPLLAAPARRQVTHRPARRLSA